MTKSPVRCRWPAGWADIPNPDGFLSEANRRAGSGHYDTDSTAGQLRIAHAACVEGNLVGANHCSGMFETKVGDWANEAMVAEWDPTGWSEFVESHPGLIEAAQAAGGAGLALGLKQLRGGGKGRLSDPLPNGLSKKFVNAYDDIRAGRGVPQTDPQTGQPKIFQGNDPHSKFWSGSQEYRVPGTKGDSSRILVKTLPNGEKVMGWTNDHCKTINRFSAPHFPDSGW